jgi:hypothetical protein
MILDGSDDANKATLLQETLLQETLLQETLLQETLLQEAAQLFSISCTNRRNR